MADSPFSAGYKPPRLLVPLGAIGRASDIGNGLLRHEADPVRRHELKQLLYGLSIGSFKALDTLLALGPVLEQRRREQQLAWAYEQERIRQLEKKYTPSPAMTTSTPSPARQSAERAPAPPVQVESLRFFESAHSFPDEGDRLFTTTFSRSVTRFVWFFLEMRRQPTPHDQRVHGWNRYYDIDGRLLCENHLDVLIEASCESWWYEKGYGCDQPGMWKPGKYRVEIGIDGGACAKGSFMIV